MIIMRVRIGGSLFGALRSANSPSHSYLHKLVLLAVFTQAANGIRPATAQHDGTRTPRPTVPSCCAVVVRSCGLYLLRPGMRKQLTPDYTNVSACYKLLK